MRRAFDLGITHFDLANNYGPPYGSAEENFGRILATDLRGYRDELVISTKAGYDMWPGAYGNRLAQVPPGQPRPEPGPHGRPYVDIFYSHRVDPDTPLEETMGALDTTSARARRCTPASPPTRRSGPARRPRSCAASAPPCSSTSRRTRC